jgi:hypothetical protein
LVRRAVLRAALMADFVLAMAVLRCEAEQKLRPKPVSQGQFFRQSQTRV